MKRRTLYLVIGLAIINAAVLVAAISFLPAVEGVSYNPHSLLGKFYATTQLGLVFRIVLVSGMVSTGVFFIIDAFRRDGRDGG